MKLLHLIHSTDAAGGGPIACIQALAPALEKLGHENHIVSLDPRPISAGEFGAATMDALGVATSSYGRTPRLQPWLIENRHRFDAAIVHGLWQYHGLAASRTLPGHLPYFVFPHGMLDPWFKRTYPAKHFKKWLYWLAIERTLVRRATAMLFTCEEERRLAQDTFRPYRATERIVSLGMPAPSAVTEEQHAAFRATVPGLGARPYLLFFGRIHPKKGVDLLLGAYRALTQSVPADQLPALVIAGPDQLPDYGAQLRRDAATLPAHATVYWPGMLRGDAKWGALAGASAFVLPSHQENFGLAVVEALAVGTPVLISNQVNIWREIVDDHAGLVAADDLPGTTKLLADWQALSADDHARMRIAATRSFSARFEVSAFATNLLSTVRSFPSVRA